MKVCYLHLGFHKTATTSIQLTCRNNSEILKKQNIETPIFRNEKNKISANHTGQLRNIFDPSNQKLFHKIKSKAVKPDQNNSLNGHIYEFHRLLGSEHNIFLSGEGIPLFRKDSLERMIIEIEAQGFQIYPFALVRSPYAYLNSALQQTIKGGRHHPWIGLGEHHSPNFGIVDTSQKLPTTVPSIKRLQSIFANSIHFYPFNEATKEPGGPVIFVLKNILKQDNLNEFKLANTNQSLSNLATRVQNMLNKDLKRPSNHDLKKLTHNLDCKPDAEKFLLTLQEFQAIEPQFKEIQASMNQLLGQNFTAERIQFADNNSLEVINKNLVNLSLSLYNYATKKSIQQ